MKPDSEQTPQNGKGIVEEPGWGFSEILIVFLGSLCVVNALVEWGQDWISLGAALLLPNNTELGGFYVTILVQSLTTLLLMAATSVWTGHASWKDFGIRPLEAKNVLAYGVGGGVLLFMIILGFTYALAWLNPYLGEQSYARALTGVHGWQDFLYLLSAGVIIVPLVEEIFFRGMIYPATRRHFGRTWGIIICGLIFGCIHFDLWRLVPLAVGGVILTWIYDRSGNVLVSAVAHGVWNGLMTVFLYLSIVR